jgi:hypothetical protein
MATTKKEVKDKNRKKIAKKTVSEPVSYTHLTLPTRP